MRDPFESSPALRLGDAKAKPRETGILQGAEIVAVEPPKTDTAIPRLPSLAPEFSDAFGAAFSKPRTYSFADVDFCVGGVNMGSGVDDSEIATVSRETLVALLGNVAHETRGARADDVTITGVVRKPVGDGAIRYEPRGFVEIKWPRDVSEETIDLLIESYVDKGLFPSLTSVEARAALRRGYEAAKAAYRARTSK